VGSSNIDPFSLLLAREANVVIEDRTFAEELRESLLKEMEQGAAQLQLDRWANEPLPLRAATWISYGIARLLTGTFAYGRKEEFA
jgi:cardiolipin synthase